MGFQVRGWIYLAASAGLLFLNLNHTQVQYVKCLDRFDAKLDALSQNREQGKINQKEFEDRLERIHRNANPASPLEPCPEPNYLSQSGAAWTLVSIWGFLLCADAAVQILLWKYRRTRKNDRDDD